MWDNSETDEAGRHQNVLHHLKHTHQFLVRPFK
jgi:hypothetical protein